MHLERTTGLERPAPGAGPEAGAILRVFLLCLVSGVFWACPQRAEAANGTPIYFDVNGTTAGFGNPSGTYALSGSYWTTDPTGTATPSTFIAGSQLTFGSASTDFNGCSFTINCDIGNPPNFRGLVISGTNVTITLNGSGNFYQGAANSWTVPAGSTLNEAIRFGGIGLNWSSGSVTLSGGGVINFVTSLGYNDGGGRIVQDDAGAGLVINLYTNRATASTFGGGFTLAGGRLNFASTLATNALGTGGTVFTGGLLDNTSGSPMTLCDMSSYVITNGFTFLGSSSLNLGTQGVSLATTATITVSNGNLTVGGVVGGVNGLNKAGAGTLTLSRTNTYIGNTIVSNGTLAVQGSIATSPRVTVETNALLSIDNAAGNAIGDNATLVLKAGPAATGKVQLAAGVVEKIGSLYFDGVAQAIGSWGSTLSSADHTDDAHFSGTGILSVGATGNTVTWSNNAASTSWATAANWAGGVAPVAGDNVRIFGRTAGGAFSPTDNSAYSGVAINSLVLQGGPDGDVSVTPGSGVTIGGGGISNNMASGSLFLGAVTLAAEQTWGGSRAIFCGAVGGNFKLIFNGAALRIDSAASTFSGGLEVRNGMAIGAYGAGGTTTTGMGTGPITLINQRSDGVTSSSPTISFGGAASVNGAAPLTVANNIILQDKGTAGNFGIQAGQDCGSTSPCYIISGEISGAVNAARTLTWSVAANITSAVFRLTGSNTCAAKTIIGTNTTLQLGNGGATGSFGTNLVTINAGGRLAFERSDALTFTNVITGGGSLVKSGAGTLTLAGTNNYTGDTIVSAAVLAVTGTIAGSTNIIVGTNATLNIVNGVANVLLDSAVLNLCAGPSTTGKVQLVAGAVETIGSLYFDGVAQPAGMWGSSASSAQFKDDAHFAGTGILAVGAFGADGAWAGDVDGTWSVAGNWTNSAVAQGAGRTAYFTNAISASRAVNQDSVSLSLGNLTFGSPGTYGWTVSNQTILLLPTSGVPVIAVTTNTATVSCVLTGSVGFVKTGAGTLVLGTNNWVGGPVVASNGTVSAAHTNAFGGAGATVTINGGTLHLGTDSKVSLSNLFLQGNGGIVLDRATPGAGFTTTVTDLTNNTGTTTLTVSRGANVTSGTAGLSIGGQWWQTSSTHIFDIGSGAELLTTATPMPSMGHTINVTKNGAGRLVLGGSYGQWDNGVITHNAGILELRTIPGDNSQYRAPVTATTGAVLVLKRDTAYDFVTSLTLNGSMTTMVDRLNSGAGVGHMLSNLTFAGNYTMALTAGDNVASGTAGLTFGGTCTLNGDATFLVSSGVTAACQLTLQSVTGSGRNLVFGGNGNLTVGGVINTGTGGVVKIGTGTLAFLASNTFTGGVAVSNGTLRIGAAGSVAGSSNITVGSGARLTVENTGNVFGDGAVVNLASGSTVYLTNGASETVNMLFIDGQACETGSWGAANCRWTNSLFAGAGVLVVTNKLFPFAWQFGQSNLAFQVTGARTNTQYSLLRFNSLTGTATVLYQASNTTSFGWVLTNALGSDDRRFYRVAEMADGVETTNVWVYTVFRKQLAAGVWTKYALGIDYGESNRLNSTLGSQLAQELTGSNDKNAADLLYVMDAGGGWAMCYLDGSGTWRDFSSAAATNTQVLAWQSFWVKRRNIGGTVEPVYSGFCVTGAVTVAFRSNDWHMITWPLPYDRKEGEGSAKGWGLAAAGAKKGTSWVNADVLTVGENSALRFYYLNTNGCWSAVGSTVEASNLTLRTGESYYYLHRGTGFTWTVVQP